MLKNERRFFDKIKNKYFFTIYIIAKTRENKELKEMFLKSTFEQHFEKIFKKDQKNNENKKFKIVNGEIIYLNTKGSDDDQVSLTELYEVENKIKTVENSDNSKKENKKDKPDNRKRKRTRKKYIGKRRI